MDKSFRPLLLYIIGAFLIVSAVLIKNAMGL